MTPITSPPTIPSLKKQNNLNLPQETKDVHAASADNRDQKKDSATQILKFLSKAMETLNVYEKQWRRQNDIESALLENVTVKYMKT